MSSSVNAKITGILYITATAAGFISAILVGSVLEATDFLTEITKNENTIILGALLELVMAFSVGGIAISMYPVLKKYNSGAALGAVGFRIMEGVLFAIGVMFLLLLLTIGNDFVDAGSPSDSYYQTLGLLFKSELPWTIGGLSFTMGALLYYILFYQTQLIPRWLSIFGLLAVVGAFTSYLVQFLGINIELIAVLHLPMLVQEMVFAIWLLIKGYNE